MSSLWTPTSLLFTAGHPAKKILSSTSVLDILMPPIDPTTVFTTVFGTNRSYVPPPGPPPNAGNLAVTNAANTDSAYSYVTALSAVISDSSAVATTLDLAGTFQLQGMFCRGTVQNIFRSLISGYRFDMLTGNLRLFRADPPGPLTLITSNFVGGYYIGGAITTLHMASTPTQIQCFASAPGQANTPTLLGTGVDVALYPTGRIGLLDFSNPAGEVLGGWSRYTVLSIKV